MADDSKPERPRVEPEIIPPDRSGRGQQSPHPYGYGTQAPHRIYVARVGPLGFTLLMLAVGLLAAVFLFVILGAIVIWLPFVALVVIIGALLRYLFR